MYTLGGGSGARSAWVGTSAVDDLPPTPDGTGRARPGRAPGGEPVGAARSRASSSSPDSRTVVLALLEVLLVGWVAVAPATAAEPALAYLVGALSRRWCSSGGHAAGDDAVDGGLCAEDELGLG